ncbi:hypothetical protein CDAR_499421 [Caerostris darwini]|uniref:Uncharacterized protein n=1 Tax=Caerostris darwini TaxID=1538125 RepID=A0AAV4TJ25_9ARAC|nr:hypothetical protein CDAR_499421 [Caerostris darwini]
MHLFPFHEMSPPREEAPTPIDTLMSGVVLSVNFAPDAPYDAINAPDDYPFRIEDINKLICNGLSNWREVRPEVARIPFLFLNSSSCVKVIDL